MKKVIRLIVLSSCLLYTSCTNSPKEGKSIENIEQSEIRNNIFSTNTSSITDSHIHKVIVLDILEASKYTYLYVSEGGSEVWLATLKDEFSIGEEYYYTKALHKTNFKSKEHNRVFDNLYLVSKLMPASHAQNANTHEHGENCNHNISSQIINNTSFNAEGEPVQVSVSDLVAMPENYLSNYVVVTGVCTKVNNAIMDRNWVHIKDGTLDSYDLIVTTQENIVKGQELSLKARVALNKDFGAGYSYSLILEEGELLP